MKTISVTELKAHLSRELRRVRRGERIVVTDRDHAIAELIPYAGAEFEVIPPEKPKRPVRPPARLRLKGDPLRFLWADRQGR